MDELDRLLVNRLQHGLLVRHPWEALAEELGSSAETLRQRVRALLDDGTLTRFGPMFDVDRLGGAFTLAALAVPEARFDEVAALLEAMPEVAHNYRREHPWNMWFVLGCETPCGHCRSHRAHRGADRPDSAQPAEGGNLSCRFALPV